jgi:glycosyltransferase involved in cell wall biosynthesis
MSGQSGEETQTVLLISNVDFNDENGRAEKFSTRERLLRERGWELKLCYVNPTVWGVLIGVLRGLWLVRSADVVNSVCNPPHLHIVGGVVSKLGRKPWLAEFRDPLVTNPDVETGSVSERLRKYLESYILREADSVVWYDGIQLPENYFLNQYPDATNEKVCQLPPIGYEKKKFSQISPAEYESFNIVYAGSFYEGWIEPYTFIEGVREYVSSNPEADLDVFFYGDWNSEYDTVVEQAGVEESIHHHPFVPHEEIVKVMKGADALLYIGGADPENRRNLPSKLYDYIGAGRPIIAIVDMDFRVADLIREQGIGIVVPPESPEDVRDAIEQIRNGDYRYDPVKGDELTRERSNAVYTDALDRLLTSE